MEKRKEDNLLKLSEQKEEIGQDSYRKEKVLVCGARNHDRKAKIGIPLETKRPGLNVWKSLLLIATFDEYY